MTNEEIIDMARQAGWEMDDSLVLEPEIVWYICQGQMECFAKLVETKEREACAKIADGWPDYDVQGLADAIRARGQE
jgi:hypothetical protein